MTLGIAILGTGSIATRAFGPAVNAVDGARLTAVLSRDRARGEAFAQQFGIPAVCDNLEALLQRPDVQAIIVATPDTLHEAQVVAAARAGVHVLCEKPMTSTYAGCQRMAEAVRTSGITFAMGYSMRFKRGLQRVEQLIRERRIGQLHYARALWTTLTPNAADGWRAQRDQARYWALSAVGTHLVDLWRWYFGDPASLGGGIAQPVYQGPNDEVSVLVFNYPGRLVAELAVTALYLGGNRLELFGDEGMIIGNNLFGYLEEGVSLTCNGAPVAFDIDTPVDPFVAEVADFVRAIETGQSPRVTLEDGMRNVHILETARDHQLQIMV